MPKMNTEHDSRLLRTHMRNVTLADDGEHLEGGPFVRLMRGNNSAFIGYSIALIAATVVLIIVLKTYLKQRWGVTCCTGENRGGRGAQIRSDAAMAAELQRELDAEAKQLALERKRAARRKEMAVALGGVTMIVDDKHLQRVGNGADDNDDDDDELDLEAGCGDGEGELILRIPVPGEDDMRTLQRDGHCAICLGDYEAGDAVIWSLNDACTHAFHEDCILTWLSRNKKKCPCCRLEFIPKDDGATAKDKDVDGNPGVDTAVSAETADESGVFVEEDLGEEDTDENEDEDEQVLAEIAEHRRESVTVVIAEDEQEQDGGSDDVV
mmetsp:Transcript_5069/g.11054  ORF Transcript_5069/g.11054 Transcript_5069/m.11054 type:complete len:324 (+) Transcript_5069:248-1219(+)